MLEMLFLAVDLIQLVYKDIPVHCGLHFFCCSRHQEQYYAETGGIFGIVGVHAEPFVSVVETPFIQHNYSALNISAAVDKLCSNSPSVSVQLSFLD